MTEVQEERKGIDVLDVAFKTVGAVTATIGAARAVRNAVNAWQRVATTVRGDRDEHGEGEHVSS